MNRLVFLFLSILYISVSILSFAKSIDMEAQLIVSGVLIAIFGIPHGAVDHILFMTKTRVSHFKFYAVYFLLMIIYLILWYFLPVVALILFLLLSAYHFGESQLSNIKLSTIQQKVLYTIWGINILSALIYYNQTEISQSFSQYYDLHVLLQVLESEVHFVLMTSTSVILACCVIYAVYSDTLRAESVLKEVFTLVVIHISFVLLPLIVGFTLYFVVLHSLRVLQDEFHYLRNLTSNFTIGTFIKQLLPFSLLSIIGCIGVALLVYLGLLQVSYILLAIILISIVTLPHALVMYRFYTK